GQLLQRTFEKVRGLVEIQPQQAMAFQGMASRTKGVGTGFDASIRKEFSVTSPADRAADPAARIEQAHEVHARSRDALEVFARDKADEPGDQFLHVWPTKIDNTTDRKSTRLNSSHVKISYAVFCLK